MCFFEYHYTLTCKMGFNLNSSGPKGLWIINDSKNGFKTFEKKDSDDWDNTDLNLTLISAQKELYLPTNRVHAVDV